MSKHKITSNCKWIVGVQGVLGFLNDQLPNDLFADELYLCRVPLQRRPNNLENLLIIIPPYHTATYCNILQHTATYCNILQHTATYCNILQHTATYGNILQQPMSIHTFIHHSYVYIYIYMCVCVCVCKCVCMGV